MGRAASPRGGPEASGPAVAHRHPLDQTVSEVGSSFDQRNETSNWDELAAVSERATHASFAIKLAIKQEPPPIAIQKTRFRGFQLFFENAQATDSMLRAIDDFPSFFSPSGESPLIVDCGANIGVSVLEWKYRWPMSRVICFEPDPFAFQLLELNVERNDLPGVTCIQSAVADFDGRASMHGNVGRGEDSRGNSLQPSWGRRPASKSVEVNCTRLTPYLTREPVAFLKLDIEGSEESVLRDAAMALPAVHAAYVEVHETEELMDLNSAPRIEAMLRQAGFQIEVETRYGPHALPGTLRSWQRRVGARQTQLLCWRDEASTP